ncbi:acrosin-like [Aphis gossypii]|uniref:acrosin-like n=1 Tax=Aphis gossypii TaxID=80765 RepID=UPI002159216F|nr:acrosin-like [Aphis gossypii]
MAERANNPPPNRNNRPSRGMIAAHVEKLRAMAGQLLREARRLSGDGPENMVSGWSAERAATASFGRIRASPTAWALFERGFAEGRRSTRPLQPAVQPPAPPPAVQPPVPPPAQQPTGQPPAPEPAPGAAPPAPAPTPTPPIQPSQPPATPEAQLAVVERWIEEMEVTHEADTGPVGE